MDSVTKNLKRAYRETEQSSLPDRMAELLRKLQEQDSQTTRGGAQNA